MAGIWGEFFQLPGYSRSYTLTPVSSSASPPLHHRTASKTTQAYRPSPTAVAGAQGPTPPNTSRMYYSNYDLSSSKSSSPIPVHAQVTEGGGFDMAQFVTANSPSAAQHPSPAEEIPPQIDPYLGNYAVSTGNEMGSEMEVNQQPFYDPPSGLWMSIQRTPAGVRGTMQPYRSRRDKCTPP